MWSNDDAPAALELASEPNADVVPPIAPGEPVPSPDRATPDNVHVLADLPIYLEPKEKELSLDEKVGNLIFLVEHQINALVPEVRAAGRLPELFRRVRKSIDKLEAEEAADDCNVAIDHATPVQEQMPPTPVARSTARSMRHHQCRFRFRHYERMTP